MSIVNLAAYKFVSIASTADWRAPLRERCEALGLRGTILLAPEGINLFLAGPAEATDAFLAYLRGDALFEGKFADLEVKVSHSDKQPFRRMLVKLKNEIITMHSPSIRPEAGRAPAVDARTLKRWLDDGVDDAGRPVVMLDTRNAFEVDVGTFDRALDYRIGKFSEFPQVVADNRADFEGKTVVSFCTGGIRCEKAAIHMENVGIDHVYQLEGGILKYFEEVGGAHYTGDCFVFDYRTALTPTLEPAATVQCFACRAVVDVAAQQTSEYKAGEYCPACYSAQREAIDTRNARSSRSGAIRAAGETAHS
ncbi:sulfurtransferase [Pararobbsia silviterrae]|uniref:tRNA uridine(34) hydroxylase n=1 Tax=Pararobbsia silviterrae TaxID=1792498 RepID=A0A494Y2J5_9BURK|nr:sulfurtransferase [Pararobbsia silviterrae]RKP56499.1 sulfurtransferase [Pararobbsia silviterrae]